MKKRGSVDARLDTIQNELHKERHMLQKNQENVGQLSSQLQLVMQKLLLECII